MKTSFLPTLCGLFAVTLLFPFQDEQIDWSKQELTVGDIQHKVKEYNAQVNSNLYMVVVSDFLTFSKNVKLNCILIVFVYNS